MNIRKVKIFYLPAYTVLNLSRLIIKLWSVDLNKHLPALHELYLAWHQTT